MDMNEMMKNVTVGLALAAAWAGTADVRIAAAESSVAAAMSQEAREAPEAEEAYREAREAVVRGQFERAADMLARFRDRFPQTRYAADSYYWEAFAKYRMEELQQALETLQMQLESYPTARISEDARDLQLRIRSMMGRRGNAQEAELALRQAELALAAQTAAGEVRATHARMLAERALARSEMVADQAVDRARIALEMAAARGEAAQEGCEGDEVRQAALQALMQMESERALPLLRGVLERRDECSVALRKQAIFVLGQMGPGAGEELILEVARSDPDPEVQEAAVFWLSQSGSDRAVEALIEILESSDNPALQENAIFALSQHMSDRAGALLRSLALDTGKSDRVREQAIFWLSQHEDHADPAFLMELYDRLDESGLKEQVFITLSQHGDPDAVDWILERALDPAEDTELRKQALFWAGQHRAVELSRLEGLYETLDDVEMKEQLIYLYAQRDEPARVDRLIEIIRAEEDPELRKSAIFWLGQTGDERAIEFLLELAGDPR